MISQARINCSECYHPSIHGRFYRGKAPVYLSTRLFPFQIPPELQSPSIPVSCAPPFQVIPVSSSFHLLVMKAAVLLAFALAIVTEASPCGGTCCFYLTASGGQAGTVGQLDDGQTRIGGGLPPAKFCLTNTSIKDSQGRGCIITRLFPLAFLSIGFLSYPSLPKRAL